MSSEIPSGSSNIEHSAWLKDWGESTPPDASLFNGVNTINIFEGKIDYVNGKWTINGIGNWTTQDLKKFISDCHAKGIAVKVSIGGAGGQAIYNKTWDQLTEGNVNDVAKGLADFCKSMNIDGIDFDYEEQKDSAQRGLVGSLIKDFKEADPSLQASLCTNAGTTWHDDLKEILDAAKKSDGSNSVDRIYVMSYDFGGQNLADDKKYMLEWKDVMKSYGIDPAHISIGVDPTDPTMSKDDKEKFIQFARQNGFSTAMWDQMDYKEYNYTKWVYDTYETPPQNRSMPKSHYKKV